jgi:hypothetical protein
MTYCQFLKITVPVLYVLYSKLYVQNMYWFSIVWAQIDSSYSWHMISTYVPKRIALYINRFQRIQTDTPNASATVESAP